MASEVYMTFEDLSSIAEELNITTYFWHLRNKKAFSFNDGANGVIVIDTSGLESEREKKKIYSEELGHCTTKAFYPFQYCAEPLKRSNIEKAEYKAQEASYIFQIPFLELREAIKKSSCDYEVAELLDVDMETLYGAVNYYQRKGLLPL